MTTVSILHCGDTEELDFLTSLEDALSVTSSPPFFIEYTKFNSHVAKDNIIVQDAHKYKQNKSPLIVLLSKRFFEVVWTTVNKAAVLNVIGSYSLRNGCVHVWLDVGVDDVRKRSKVLLRPDNYFRKVKRQELNMLSQEDMLNKLAQLLRVNTDGKFNPLNNYAVDDEIDAMRINFQKSLGINNTSTTTTTTTTTTTSPQHSPKRTGASISSEDFDPHHFDSESMGTESSSSRNAHASKKKKKKKKTGATISPTTKFSEIPDSDLEQIGYCLSKGPGVNWKQLAQAFSFPDSIIKSIQDEHSHDALRSQTFLTLLRTTRTDVDIEEFLRRCRQIIRHDVVNLINDNVLSEN